MSVWSEPHNPEAELWFIISWFGLRGKTNLLWQHLIPARSLQRSQSSPYTQLARLSILFMDLSFGKFSSPT